jgi:hypothetical protein
MFHSMTLDFGFGEAEIQQLYPVAVSMMLPGLRSRWTTPMRWALSKRRRLAFQTLGSDPSTKGLESSRESITLDAFHYQKIDPLVVSDVMQRTNMRMV